MNIRPITPGSDGKWYFSAPHTLWDHLTIAMVKDFPRFAETGPAEQTYGEGDYLHVGYGNKMIAEIGWTHIDYPEWDGETDKLPYNDASFDGIVCYHTLDHIANARGVLREFERVLKDDGWVVIVVPHYASELANADLDHKSRYALDTWENAFSQKHYDNQGEWQFDIGFNMLMALTERNAVVVTQLWRKPRDTS